MIKLIELAIHIIVKVTMDTTYVGIRCSELCIPMASEFNSIINT